MKVAKNHHHMKVSRNKVSNGDDASMSFRILNAGIDLSNQILFLPVEYESFRGVCQCFNLIFADVQAVGALRGWLWVVDGLSCLGICGSILGSTAGPDFQYRLKIDGAKCAAELEGELLPLPHPCHRLSMQAGHGVPSAK